MEACIVICRTKKASGRRGQVLFIDAVNEVVRERAQSFLNSEHQARIGHAYAAFNDEHGFAKVATSREISDQAWSLSIPLYVKKSADIASTATSREQNLGEAWRTWETTGRVFWTEISDLADMLDGIVAANETDVMRG